MDDDTTKHRGKGSPTKKPESRRQQAMEGMMKRNKTKSFFTVYGYHIVIGLFVFVCVAAVIFVLS